MLKHSMYINNKNNNNKINIAMFDCFIYNFKRKNYLKSLRYLENKIIYI